MFGCPAPAGSGWILGNSQFPRVAQAILAHERSSLVIGADRVVDHGRERAVLYRRDDLDCSVNAPHGMADMWVVAVGERTFGPGKLCDIGFRQDRSRVVAVLL